MNPSPNQQLDPLSPARLRAEIPTPKNTVENL